MSTKEAPGVEVLEVDLSSPRFRAGVARGQWRVVSYQFPLLVIAVAAIEPNGDPSEYGFRFELTGFPGTAPAVVMVDLVSNTPLPVDRRPRGSARVAEAFKKWQTPPVDDPVYRPWERTSGAHGDWARKHPDLIWNAKRDLSFILEDLNGLLTSNATGRSAG